MVEFVVEFEVVFDVVEFDVVEFDVVEFDVVELDVVELVDALMAVSGTHSPCVQTSPLKQSVLREQFVDSSPHPRVTPISTNIAKINFIGFQPAHAVNKASALPPYL